MEVELQFATLRMSPTTTPTDLRFALEVAAPRVEWTEVSVSMPADFITL